MWDVIETFTVDSRPILDVLNDLGGLPLTVRSYNEREMTIHYSSDTLYSLHRLFCRIYDTVHYG
ncbi:MAG: hypothetical protein GF368_00725 [Candidatus Aenigmarchaeota archaeon]|nr:hypothetical protein [Candidatus Aenigmarchaeota archaeon]